VAPDLEKQLKQILVVAQEVEVIQTLITAKRELVYLDKGTQVVQVLAVVEKFGLAAVAVEREALEVMLTLETVEPEVPE
jgi:hypothetical protein